MPAALLLILAVAPAALILAYYLRIVRRAPEPWIRVTATCLAGAAAFFAAGPLEHQAAAYVPRAMAWAWSFGVVAPVEELLKLAAVLVAAPWPTRYERVSSGLMYGVAAGVGFACVENVAYVFTYGVETGLVRAVTAVPSHALHGAIVGLGLATVHRTGRWRPVVVAVVVAVAFHGTYDGVLLGAPTLRGIVVGVLICEAIAVRYAVRRALERDLQRDIDLLGAVPLFEGVTSASRRVLAAGATRVRAAAKTPVVRKGNAGDAMFQILRGALEVRIDGEVVRTLGARDFFGELALLTGAPRSADVIATSNTLLMRVGRRAFAAAVRDDEAFARVVLERARGRVDADQLPDFEAMTTRARAEIEGGATGALAEALSRAELLASLPADDLTALAASCLRVQRGPGAKIVREGRAGHGLYLLLTGQAAVTLGRRRLTTLVEGDFFSEISLLTGWNATATVTASTPVELALLRWIDLEPIVAKNPTLGSRLLEALEVRAARGLEDPSGHTSLAERIGRAMTRATRAVSPLDERAEAVFRDHPDVRSLPRSTAETLAAYDTPDALGDADLREAIAHCPSVLRFYARLAIRRALAARST